MDLKRHKRCVPNGGLMAGQVQDQQTETWERLHRNVWYCLKKFETEDFIGRGDYWILDDNYGFKSINVAVHRLAFLRPHVVEQLHKLLDGYPGWEIKISVDVPGKEHIWPEMG